MAARYPLVLNGTSIQELQSGDDLVGYLTFPTANTTYVTLSNTSYVTTSNTSYVTTTGTQTPTNKTLTGLKETRVAIAASDIDLSLGNYFTKTISGTTTLTVSNVPSSNTATAFILELTNGGSATVNWWSNTKWVGGVAPTLTSAGRDVLGFYTYDNGTTWNGFVVGKDVK